MKASPVVRAALATLGLLVVWAAVVFFWTVEGWGREPLAPRGDTAAFMRAGAELLESTSAGNAVFALLEEGAVFDEHAVSVGAPVDANTVFQVASLSKWITAWGVMALVDQGTLDLDAPVGARLTRWRLPESGFDNDGVTVRRLLSHTAGLTDGLGYGGFEPGAPVQPLEESLTRAADASPGASGVVRVGYEPGSDWQYSGGGYALLQLLVEEASGEPFESFMQRTVFGPVGMSRSSYEWRPDGGSTLATFYDVDSRPATHYRFSVAGAASLYTSVSDLTRFIQAHLPGPNGEPAGRGVLEAATLAEMRRPHASKYGQAIWGLGTMLYAGNDEGDFVVGHDGNNDPAINTAARFNPTTGNGIVVLETGNPLLATMLAGEWVFWETGNLDFLMVMLAVPEMLRVIGVGSAAIVLAAVVLVLASRPARL